MNDEPFTPQYFAYSFCLNNANNRFKKSCKDENLVAADVNPPYKMNGNNFNPIGMTLIQASFLRNSTT
jgi:hypothetical protein